MATNYIPGYHKLHRVVKTRWIKRSRPHDYRDGYGDVHIGDDYSDVPRREGYRDTHLRDNYADVPRREGHGEVQRRYGYRDLHLRDGYAGVHKREGYGEVQRTYRDVQLGRITLACPGG